MSEPVSYKSHVGTTSEEFRESVTAERVSAFCAAVGARDRGVAPPTFMTIGRAGEFEILERLGFPLKRILHAEQAYTYGEPLRAGDELFYRTTLTQVLEKRGGSGGMIFFVMETTFEISRGGADRLQAGMAKTNLLVRLAAGEA